MYFYAVFLLDSLLTFRTVIGGELPDFGVGIGMSGQVARFSVGEKGFAGWYELFSQTNVYWAMISPVGLYMNVMVSPDSTL